MKEWMQAYSQQMREHSGTFTRDERVARKRRANESKSKTHRRKAAKQNWRNSLTKRVTCEPWPRVRHQTGQ
jgi:hypothetical protein